MVEILLQSTIVDIADDWNIGRFALLAEELRGAGHDVTARDHQELGSSLLRLGSIGRVNHFHDENPEADPERDEQDNPNISWPNYPPGSGAHCHLDPVAAVEVAAAHIEAARVGGALARAAYELLVRESDRLFRRVTETGRPDRVRIFFTVCPTPYAGAGELISSVARDRVLEVTTAARERDRSHPLMGCEVGGAYDRFRAVHDVLGHGRLNVGFDRDGEFAAWRFQERFHSRLARRALATELHGEHSVRWTTGEVAEHKAVLLDERLVHRSRAGR